jgi:hypothetical protein
MVVSLFCYHVSHAHVILVHVAITLQALQQQLYFNDKKLDVANLFVFVVQQGHDADGLRFWVPAGKSQLACARA